MPTKKNFSVAQKLSFSISTLERHLKAIYEKIGRDYNSLNLSNAKGKYKVLLTWLEITYKKYKISEQIPISNEIFTVAITDRVQQLTTSDQYYRILTQIVTKPRDPCELYVSIGEGDFLYAWLTRLYYEKLADEQPQIKKIIIKRLSDDIIEDYIVKERLRKSFRNKLNKNITAIVEDDEIKRNKIEVEIRYWNNFPKFHGYLCEDEMLIGKWQNSTDGYLHVKTPLSYIKKQFFPQEYSLVMAEFETPGRTQCAPTNY